MADCSLDPQQISGDTGVIDAGIQGLQAGIQVLRLCNTCIPASVIPVSPRV